nr:hypothetical protein [Secundilactobacillus silagei]
MIAATFKLQTGDPAQIQAKMDELNARRAAKQPLDLPSCGSVFKRPTGYFAGKLIHDAGLQGYQSGGAQVSMKHAVHRERWPCYGDGLSRCYRPRSGNGFDPGGRSLGDRSPHYW